VTAIPATNPNLELFEDVIEQLACDPRIAPQSPDWIRQTLVLGGEKAKIMRYIWRHAPSGQGEAPRVLDVGAQIGAFALYAARTGCKVAAVDLEMFTRIYAVILAGYGVDYRTCDVGSELLPFADSAFDAVTYNDVIEHHSFSPKRVLREIHRVLVPGGLVFVSTPNHASLYNRLLLMFGKSINDPFRAYFDSSDDQRVYLGHHREYTRAELLYALEHTGFKVRDCRVVDEDIRALLYFLRRRSSLAEVFANSRALLVRLLGSIWSPLRLPFGRVLWAVGEKRAQSFK
jgi:2-polyprenyl-3-methyl-5-hydroxy-6-metoxy-1,4-benzoquinol methylase